MPRPLGYRLTHCKRGHPFSAANTHTRLDGRRMCRTCNRERQRERRAAKRCPRCFGTREVLIRGDDGRLKTTLLPCPLCRPKGGDPA